MAATVQEETIGRPDSPPLVARPRPVPELVRGLAVFAVYLLVNGIDWHGRASSARAHSADIYSLERRLHLDPERWLNARLAPHHALRVFANYEYATTYVISAFALLYWLYRRRPELYRWARSSFIWLNLLAIACFAAYPLSPPRLSPDQGFVDTVRLGHTWGSWGSPLVGHANQLAAMPSLHFGWALWVSAVLARISSDRRVQVLSGAHVLLTLWVILATGNHYLLDAVAAAVLVEICVRRTSARTGRVAAADVFFLHVESPVAPQQVGGVVLLDLSTRGGTPPSRDEVAELVQAQLGGLPRFRQVLHGAGRADRRLWRRPVWREQRELDWSWHVPLVDLTQPDGSPGGRGAFDALVADVAATLLPRDRPMWRLIVVHGIEAGTAGVILVVHHVVADGIGTVAQALRLLTPQLPARQVGSVPQPGWWRTAGSTALGILQLATDGRPKHPLPSGHTAARSYATVQLPLREVRSVGRAHGVRAGEVLLSAVAGGLQQALAGSGPDLVRTAVPLMMRDPATAAEGNVTAAILLDLPIASGSEAERVAAVAAASGRLATPTRAMASRFVMQATGTVLPTPLHALFARTVYGHRYFSAIVSDMPGPPRQLFLLGARLEAAFPLLPLAPSAPVAVGALGWNGMLCIGISTDPAVLPAARLAEAIESVFDQLGATRRHPV
jgi:diacylglycerol O-acyltransferase / wax synthase